MANKGLLPGYFDKIESKESKERYLEKLTYISGKDPYEIPRNEFQDDVDLWPSVTYIHVGMYLLFKDSSYTQDCLMNYKSLKCYENFAKGWVREVICKVFGEKRLLIAKVNHSQRLSEKPLTPWVICEEKGKILAAHCDCMAGLGESCSHVASLLWATEAGAKRRDSLTVTDKKAYWVLPAAVTNVPYARIKDINFFKASATTPKNTCNPTPSAAKFNSFLTALKNCPSKPAALSIFREYSDAYIPKSLKPDLPPLLTELFDKELTNETFNEILTRTLPKAPACYTVTESQQKAVERETRNQSHSRLWYRMRTGRVTASKYKMACQTDPAQPSHSLIMGICYPETTKFTTEATQWGCNHEAHARNNYAAQAKESHDDFNVQDCGLFISKDHGYIGASPDGIVSCKCCGIGICEIKCPYTHKDEFIESASSDNNFCLERKNDLYGLKRTHAYYYQVQAQLLVTQYQYCDFVVWTNKSMVTERIYPDKEFLDDTIPKVKAFFERGVLPELAAKFYSSAPKPDKVVHQPDSYCYCGDDEHGTMIGCDSMNCPYKWFHLSCLKLKAPPRGRKWFCPECQKFKKTKRPERQE